MKFADLLRRLKRAEDCQHAALNLRPVVAELRGTGAGDEYHIEGLARYWCRACGREVGTGSFAGVLPARLDLRIDAADTDGALDPPFGQAGGADV